MTALLRMSAGLIVWAIAFCILYALHGIGCSAGWANASMMGANVQRVVLVAAWIGCLIAGALVVLALRRRGTAGVVDRAAWAGAWVGLAATALAGLPILTLPVCT